MRTRIYGPTVWTPEAELEPFIRLLGEMIVAGLARKGQQLAEITLNVSNVTVEPRAGRTNSRRQLRCDHDS